LLNYAYDYDYYQLLAIKPALNILWAKPVKPKAPLLSLRFFHLKRIDH
jgi:hypothetical protein